MKSTTTPLSGSSPHSNRPDPAPGELSSIAIICDGILSALNRLPGCPDSAKSDVGARIGAILDLFSQTEGQVTAAKQKISYLKVELRKTSEQLAVLRQEQFGASSEKGSEAVNDYTYDFEFVDDDEANEDYAKGKRHRKVGDDIRTIIEDHWPENMDCGTCGKKLKSIKREKRVGTLRIIPEHVELVQHVYHTCACSGQLCKDNRPILAKAKGHIMKGRGMELGFVAEAATQKFFEHSTTFRMERRLADNNINLSRQTIGANIAHVARFLEPLQDAIREHVISGHVAHMDETPLRVLNPGKGKCDTGYIWAICRDEGRWNTDAKPAVYFHYAHSRAGTVAKGLLSGGSLRYLQTDGYAGYNSVLTDQEISSVRCLLHARRKFKDALTAGHSPFALMVVQMIQNLYAVEKAAAGLPPDERVALRQTHSLPVMRELKEQLILNREDAQGSVKTAINYTLKAFDSLQQFLFDGRLEIDNNPVERCIRGVAVTKKNSYFAGSHEAAKTWATFYTIIESARLNRVNGRAYMTWVLGEIERTRGKVDYKLLMPWHCPIGRIVD
ncbi:IS66 family transposase [Roseovarius mucosus]|uniref:IS66 family transposase n=1 Tax=Roseovarius mucosus TaxID=215743 RepID=UPI0035CF003C